jgi:hypothetical protein
VVINHQRRTHLHRQPKPERPYDPSLGWSPLRMTVTRRTVADPDDTMSADFLRDEWPSSTSMVSDTLPEEP